VKDAKERNSIPMERRKEGMLVRTNEDNKEWVLLRDLETWVSRTISIENVSALEEHLNFKASSYDSNLYGKVSVEGDINTVRLNTKGHFNTGVILGESFSTGKICIKTRLLDFTINDSSVIFTVPKNYMFMIDSIEIITINVTSPNNPPHVKFGVNNEDSMLFGPKSVNSNSIGARHIIENPQQGLVEDSYVTVSIQTPSTAASHYGVGVINGYLLKVT